MNKKQNHSLAEIATRWGASHSHVLGLIYSGALPAINIGTNPDGRARYIVSDAALTEFESQRTVEVEAKPTTRRKRAKLQTDVVEFIK